MVRREALRLYSLFQGSPIVVLLMRKLWAADPFAGAHASPEIVNRSNDRRQTLWLVAITSGAIDNQEGIGFVVSLLLLLGNEPGITHVAINVCAIERHIARRH